MREQAPASELMSLREAAAVIGVCQETLRRHVRRGNVNAVRLGKRGWLRFRRDEIQRFVDGH